MPDLCIARGQSLVLQSFQPGSVRPLKRAAPQRNKEKKATDDQKGIIDAGKTEDNLYLNAKTYGYIKVILH